MCFKGQESRFVSCHFLWIICHIFSQSRNVFAVLPHVKCNHQYVLLMLFYEILKLKPTVKQLTLISRTQEMWLRTLKHTESRSWLYTGERTMVRWWKREGLIVKTQLYELETTIVWWWNNDGTMVKSWCYDGENMMVQWWNCDGIMVKTRYYFHHRGIVSSSFTIVTSYIAVQGDKICY
jgi:hypothetical protein